LESFSGFESVRILEGIPEIIDLLLSEVDGVKTKLDPIEDQQNNSKCVDVLLGLFSFGLYFWFGWRNHLFLLLFSSFLFLSALRIFGDFLFFNRCLFSYWLLPRFFVNELFRISSVISLVLINVQPKRLIVGTQS
jgi:hypothetical protein